MLTNLGLFKVMFLISMADALSQSVGYQNIEVVQRGERDYFSNPDRSCGANSCRNYQFRIVGGDCQSDNCCTCRCRGENTTFVEHTQQCMSFANIRETVTPKTAGGKFTISLVFVHYIFSIILSIFHSVITTDKYTK